MTVVFLMGLSHPARAQGIGELQVGARVVRAENTVDARARAAELAARPAAGVKRDLWSLQREVRREGPRERVRVTLNFLAN